MKGEEREVKPETMDGWSRAVPLKKKKKNTQMRSHKTPSHLFQSCQRGGGSEEGGGFLITHPAHSEEILVR